MTSKDITHIFRNISHNLDNCNDRIQSSINEILIGGNQDDKMYKRMKKYKNFVENAQQSILYFRSLAEYYYRINLLTTAYYQGVAQKLHDMKQKMLGMDSKVQNIANQYQHNSEKIQMLEYFVDMIEKMAKNPTEIDLNVKSQLNNQMLEYATKAKMSFGDAISNVKQFDLQHGGGEKSFEDLEQILMSNEQSILNSFSNIEFLNKKMTSLNERMKQVVDSNDSLFKLRAEVEWVVNTLENCADGTCDKKAVSHNFDKLWKIVNGIQEKIKTGEQYDADVVKYISGLEKYIGVLETQLSSADRTVRALDSKNDEKVKTHTEDLKTNLNAKLQAGGLLMEDEYEKENASKKTIKENIDLTHIQCTLNLENVENREYAKVVMLKTIVNTLNDVITQFYEICSKDEKFYDEQNEFNFLVLWKETFKSKRTSYYSDLLEKNIAYQTDKIIAKKFTIPQGAELKIIINIENTELLSNIITLLEDTKSFYICSNYITAKYAVGIMIIDQDEDSKNGEQIEKLNVLLKEYGNNLHKATHLTFDNFSETYDGETKQSGGGLPHMHILPQEELGDVKAIATAPQTYSSESFNMYSEFVTVTKENPDLKPSEALTAINKSVIAKIKTLDESIGDLYEMVAQKLGDTSTYDSLTKDVVVADMDLITIAENFGLLGQHQNGGRQLLGGADERPRLDPYKIQLVTCKESIKSFAGLLINLKAWMKKNSSGKLSKAKNTGAKEKYNSVSSQSKLLLQIQKSIDTTVVSGRNSYIKVIPMIFFIIEFPPHIYLNNSVNDYYKFTYGDQKIKYTHHMEDGTTDVTEYNGAHAAFFASNNKNGTSYLLKDPLIGLDKIISTSSDPTKPVNSVINMMFALGASGTGKTTRYFGKSDSPDPNDKQGIVSFVIENAKVTGASDVDVAYFVCYGQHDGKATSMLNELVIFFNNDKPGNDKYMPYNMNVNAVQSTTGYTDFYIKLMNKNLNKLSYDNVSDFLQGKVDGVTAQGTQFGSFRKIIEEDNDIWMKPSLTSEAITKLFETLIGEQKKIFTVMPTKNNIESSRGHTCVLIRFTYEDGTYKYFPLFDMAGTENPKEVKEFFETFKYVKPEGGEEIITINKLKLAKLIKQINLAHDSISDDIAGKETTMQSLTDLLNKSEKARKYVGAPQAGGAKKIQDLMDLANQDNATLNAEKFLGKLGKEGYYINHTIAMLIFAALCVGTSLNTTQVGDVDNFDGFEDALNQELQSNYICLLDKDVANSCTNTRFILDKYGFAEILSKSCIWTQILFSFLYWNSDTQSSYDTLCYQLYTYYDQPELFNRLMSYYVGRSDKFTDIYHLETYIKDDAVYDSAVKLCDVLGNTSISNVIITQDGITFSANKSNYQIVITGGKVGAEKIEEETGVVAKIYVGARKSGDIAKNSTKPIESEANMTEEKINKISLEVLPKKINVLTYNLYLLSNALMEIINSQQQSYVNAINTNQKITELINKIFVLGDSGKYIDDIHSIIVGSTTGYKAEHAPYTNIQKMTLLKSVKFPVSSLEPKGVVVEKEHVKYLNKLISTITKHIDFNEEKTNKKIATYRASLVDPIVNLINSANMSEDSYNLVLLSQQPTLAEAKTALSTSLQFSKTLKSLIDIGKHELAPYKDSMQEYNQIKRIKDGSLSATKMTMMHLVTGQTYKTKMVQNTLELCQVLYNSTDLKL